MTDKEYIGSEINYTSNTNNQQFAIKNKSENVERNALPQPVQNFLQQHRGIKKWETDPQTLYDYSDNLISNAFIDTLSKDIANTKYNINDSEKAKELFKNPHPEKTFSDLMEEIMNDLLRTGNAFIVVNRYGDGSPAELVIPPASTMFMHTDDDGYLQGYVQKIGQRKTQQIDKDDVYHIKWTAQNNRYYGKGPTEMSMDSIDVIDELTLKEILDLSEGGISAIISQSESHNRDPMNSQEWSSLVTKINNNKGERQENVIAKGSWESTTVSTNYSEMELIDRYKYRIQLLAGAYKVNPSYVGFDFENTNRATDQSQQEAYRQRGINTALNKLKQQFNKIIYNEFGDGEFNWSIETGKDLDEINYYEQLADTVRKLVEAGVEFNIEEGKINIPEDTEIDEDKVLQNIQEMKVLDDLNHNVNVGEVFNKVNNEKDTETKPQEVDNCVESIMNDNEDIDEETAYAICWNQQNKSSEINITEKKEEFTKNVDYGGDDFISTLIHLDNDVDSRREAIRYCKEHMSGFSPNTYYDWLDQIELNI